MLPLLAVFAAGLRLTGVQAQTAQNVAPARPSGPTRPHPHEGGKRHPNPYANAPALTDAQRAIIRATVPVLAEHGVTLTTNFYHKMFANNPDLKNVFNQAHQATGMQPKALAAAVYAYAANIDDLTPLLPAVARMAHKHASLSIVPPQYPIVGQNLLETLGELLRGAGYPEDQIAAILDAWGVAYGQLANILIQEEEKLYAAAEAAPGGWRGWRDFVVERRVPENESGDIVSFYLRPKDGGSVPAFIPGQYTCLRVLVSQDGEQFYQPRQYTLSAPPDGKTFRISVKKEVPLNAQVAPVPHPMPAGAEASQCPFLRAQAGPAGVVSNLLHSRMVEGSVVQLAPPFGDFQLDSGADGSPVVLLSAGVGLTPCASMLSTALQSGRPVSFLHGAQSGKHQAMKSWLAECKQAASKAGHKLQTAVWYSQPAPGDVKGAHYDEQGRMRLEQQHAQLLHLDNPSAQYYLCGPNQFMLDQIASLQKLGVDRARIHEEMFGAGNVQ